MFSGAFDYARLLPPGRCRRIVLRSLAYPVLLGYEEALARAWGAQVMFYHLLAREKGGVTPGAHVVTEFFHVRVLGGQLLRGEDAFLTFQRMVPRK
jgi:hypothetical protein